MTSRQSVSNKPRYPPRGPFHCVSVYYKHGDYDVFDLETEKDMRDRIAMQFELLPEDSVVSRIYSNSNVKKMPLDELIELGVLAGKEIIENEAGSGLVSVIEGGRTFDQGVFEGTIEQIEAQDEEKRQRLSNLIQQQYQMNQSSALGSRTNDKGSVRNYSRKPWW